MPISFQSTTRALAASGVLLLVGVQASQGNEFEIGEIEIRHPGSRATPTGAKTGAG